MDVKSIFLHGDLIEEIYMEKTPSFEKDGSLVCRLKKPLYGLKQALMAWYENIDNFFLNLSFQCCELYRSFYLLHVNYETPIVVLYVDDLEIIESNGNLIFSLKK